MAARVAIVGGGIGGLTLALALRRRGLEARVHEAAPELRAAGAGIWVPPNAMQVLGRLGVAEAVLREGASLDRAEIRDFRGGVLQATEIGAAARRFSRQLGRAAHLRHTLARGLRNVLLRITPASVGRRQMEALYALSY